MSDKDYEDDHDEDGFDDLDEDEVDVDGEVEIMDEEDGVWLIKQNSSRWLKMLSKQLHLMRRQKHKQ